MKVTVIMASYLSPYPGSASNPEKKFLRAVNSFKSQTYEDKELIIVSDGCQKTVELYEKYFLNDENIHLLPIQKQPLYSGEMRNVALRQANGDIICYLDADDIIGKKHIQTIIEQFTEDAREFLFMLRGSGVIEESEFEDIMNYFAGSLNVDINQLKAFMNKKGIAEKRVLN